MDLLKQTKDLCRLYGIIPARSRGQNFLINEAVYDKVIAAAGLTREDIVLEVGPGLGFLTIKLAKEVKEVIAVEMDDKLAEILETGLLAKDVKNVEVVNEDILKFSIFNFQFSNNFQLLNFQKDKAIHDMRYTIRGYKIVANLPYNITSFFLRKFLENENRPELMVLMLQKEVAERITAKPGKMSLLAVSVQFYAEPKIIEYVPKENFWPQPEVDSAIIKLKVKSEKLKVALGVDKEKRFWQMVKFGFSARRKMLKNNLAGGYHKANEIVENWLKMANIPPKARAQDLSLKDWLKLFEVRG